MTFFEMSVRFKIQAALEFLGEYDGDISQENEGVLSIRIVSDYFKDLRYMKRVDILSEAFRSLSMNELVDYTLSFDPLTKEEYAAKIKATV